MRSATLQTTDTDRSKPALSWAAVIASLALLLYSVRFVAFVGGILSPELTPFLAERDFMNYWMAGRLVLSGEEQLLFSHETYMARLTETFGPGYPIHNWSYPPHFLLFVWPLGFLQYEAGLVAFLLSTLGLFTAAVWRFRGNLAPDSSWALLAFALAPYVVIVMLATQNGFLTAAGLLFGLALMNHRPLLAGLGFACLTVKPQLGILVPVLLLFDRNWRVIAWTIFFSAALVLLSIALFGLESWAAYLSETLAYQRYVMTDWQGSFLTMMPTSFASIRTLGFAPSMASAVQLPVSIAAAAMVLWIFRKETDSLRRSFSIACGTFLITPYAFDYDMGALTAIAALLAGSASNRVSRGGTVVLTLVAMLAAAVTLLGHARLPIAPLILAAGLMVVAAEAGRAARPSPARLSPNQVS